MTEIPTITQTWPYCFALSGNGELRNSYHTLTLLRQPDAVAVEGVFTWSVIYFVFHVGCLVGIFWFFSALSHLFFLVIMIL